LMGAYRAIGGGGGRARIEIFLGLGVWGLHFPKSGRGGPSKIRGGQRIGAADFEFDDAPHARGPFLRLERA